MDKKTQTFNRVREFVKKSGSLGLIAVIVILGVILLLLPSGDSRSAETKPPEITPEIQSDTVEELERRIAKALGELEGAGKVTVVLSLQSDGEIFLATDKDEKTVNENRERSEEAVIVNSGSSVQEPVVVKHGYPEYRGALIVAEGADNPAVKLAVTQAVMALTGLGSDRVTVVKMQTN